VPQWTEFSDRFELREFFKRVGAQIRKGDLDLGKRSYALSLAQGVLQAIHCGYDRLLAVEIGVASGKGLLDLCKAASYFREQLGLQIDVLGLDNATGLPKPKDYRDHPELWQHGQYNMGDPELLRARLPGFASLMIGDVADLLPSFGKVIGPRRLAFVSVDVDFYSSAKSALQIFTASPERYLPAVPVFFDDVLEFITYNSWCGEAAAIREFNDAQPFRKIERNDVVAIPHFHCCHILDHPIRTGGERPRRGFPLMIGKI
jgi:hypothetical protein